MKTAFFGVGLVACLLAGMVIANQGDATAELASAERGSEVNESVTDQPEQTPMCQPEAASPELVSPRGEPLAKKCSFDSDCSHGKCKSGECGGCGFKSDCKGWGKCDKGKCGACSFDSECKGFGKCSKGKCTKSPYK